MRYRAVTRTHLNLDGKFGAWMFVLTPAAQYLGWLWIDSAFYRAAFLVACLALFCFSIVLLIIGRDQISEIEGG